MALDDVFATHKHKQAPHISLQPSEFNGTQFVGTLDNIRRTARGGLIISVSVEREHANAALKLWDAYAPLSFDVEAWQPFVDGFYEDDND